MTARAAVFLLLLYTMPLCAAEQQPPPRDAAEIVKEGDVSQWLEHYQRERGAEWAKQQSESSDACKVNGNPAVRSPDGAQRNPGK